MSNHIHPRRRVVGTDLRHSVEFAELLDPIGTTTISRASTLAAEIDPDMAFADTLIAEMDVSETTDGDTVRLGDVSTPAEVESAIVPEDDVVQVQVPVSRFADAGIDDDRLPLHASTKRFHLR
jgi:hypothetical protein